MILGRIAGTVVATRKDDRLGGFKLLVVETIGLDLKPTGAFTIAVDVVGAGDGEVVLVASGSSARLTVATKDKPVDAVILAIVDTVETDGSLRYAKAAAATR
jgi:microcompartment protein CcmK/EutM